MTIYDALVSPGGIPSMIAETIEENQDAPPLDDSRPPIRIEDINHNPDEEKVDVSGTCLLRGYDRDRYADFEVVHGSHRTVGACFDELEVILTNFRYV